MQTELLNAVTLSFLRHLKVGLYLKNCGKN